MEYKGQSIQCRALENDVVELIFDAQDGSVNKFDHNSLQELDEAVKLLEKNKTVKGLLITSAKDTFIVGADINQFLEGFQAPLEKLTEWVKDSQQVFSDLENLGIPSVSAINGYALGGGFELCLACTYRVASTEAKVGFPEVKLGLLPGFGGTSRLPRMIGADNAIEWIAGGKDNKPTTALEAGAVDAVVEPDILREASLDLLHRAINGELDWQTKRQEKQQALMLNENEAMMTFETARAFIAGKAGPNYPAPLTIVGVMQASANLPLKGALGIEAEGFAELAKTPEATSLIGLFLGDQLLKKNARSSKKLAVPVKRAAVLGAGIMGGGVAYQSSYKGVPISMKDIAQSQLELGMKEAAKIMQKRIDRGQMKTEEMTDILTDITPTLSYDSLADADLVVEAVVEKASVKNAVLAETESIINKNAILASNTSTISITKLAKGLERPEQFCGMHFFNPVHRMPLVEVIRGEKSSESTIASTVAYAAAMGKSPIVVNDCPGFLVNRVLFPYFAGFTGLINDGVDYVHLDKVMEKFGWPMGPANLLDVVGIDTAYHAGSVMAEGYPDRMSQEVPTIISKMFENEWFGKKNEKGFYIHSTDKKGKPKKEPNPETENILRDLNTGSGDDISDDDIIDRMMLPMLMESSRCLEDNIVETPMEVDMGLIYGLGFPPFRGGIFRWADTVGLDELLRRAEKLKPLGKLYEPTEQIRKMVKDKRLFHQIQ
ncbi:MAG: Fatty acid oxidation complex subunit alpha [Deltaproteobacteria bacterium]|jgi:3-hydroxyacyl-CoA dehydrogenase/enoyl-CoA hydratase/3-hydroxybutyryl-CoA epimerase/enoyl-CoA isomerase|nr:Fatty acid oxidation complex subunit alpha [Deltaproteobacteria bacterium]